MLQIFAICIVANRKILVGLLLIILFNVPKYLLNKWQSPPKGHYKCCLLPTFAEFALLNEPLELAEDHLSHLNTSSLAVIMFVWKVWDWWLSSGQQLLEPRNLLYISILQSLVLVVLLSPARAPLLSVPLSTLPAALHCMTLNQL